MKHKTRIALLTFAISSLFVGRNVLAEPLDAAVPVSYTHLTLPTNREV